MQTQTSETLTMPARGGNGTRPLNEAENALLRLTEKYKTEAGRVDWVRAWQENPVEDKLLRYGASDKKHKKATNLLAKLKFQGLIPSGKTRKPKAAKKAKMNPEEMLAYALGQKSRNGHGPAPTVNVDAQVMEAVLNLISNCSHCPKCGRNIGPMLQAELAAMKMGA